MTIFVFSVVLFAAALHAIWNAVVKGGADKLLTTVLVTTWATLIAAVCLPFLPAPSRESWPFIGVSTLLQVGYYVLVARTYHLADMSQTYPLMRGTAPLLVAIISVAVLGGHLSASAWVGIAIICAGILAMATSGHSKNKAGLALALLNAGVIASYTLVDGLGVRLSGAPAAYTLWIFLLTGIPLIVWTFVARRAEFQGYIAANWHLGLVGGAGTIISYGLALWAMTLAPVAVIAALRETSILFGTAISALVLKERVSMVRMVAVCIIAIGAGILRFA
ncbi:MAG: EamA family transporter [Rhizobiales bacterium]|nr:EamA family transporter [Hyphomicrobiales bacterium]